MVQGRVVFITGAASGIGLAIGKAFARQQAKVVLTDIDQQKVQTAAREVEDEGFTCIGLACDVTNEDAADEAFAETLRVFGRVDILINNAGMQYVAKLEDFPTETFEKMTKIMLTAPFSMTKKAIPIMKKQKYGRIINMSSINGVIGFAGKAGYNSAKHGLIGLTKVAALEGAEHGITVNALCPGYVDTPLVRNQLEDLASDRGVTLEKVLEEVIYPLVPQKRLLDPQEVADYALFLAGDQAKSVTGQSVLIDGGYTAQ
ncbi:3-hydroxybutyrate dehydrogenase [Marinococcus halophilus]|uniref:3-hydroxybutyrate dehydrogenase n=1 Tax=Marinococcus halophilus TaxID=1371 RepID=UPI0009A88013|nr:3-hydroxybutyrate dehydrogenase [Marinococcus halophilus]